MSNLIRRARPVLGAVATGLLALAVGAVLVIAIIAVVTVLRTTH